jgi:hypothetical protein
VNLTVREWIDLNLFGLRELFMRGDDRALDAVLEVWRLEREIV